MSRSRPSYSCIRRRADPTCQRGTRNLDALACINLRLSVQRQMIAELRNDDMGQETWSCQAAFDRPRWRRCFNHAIAAAAGELRPNVRNTAKRESFKHPRPLIA